METAEQQQKTAPGVPFTKDDPRINREGRNPLTEEQKEANKVVKKAQKEFIAEYKEKLSEALPFISPVLVAKALAGDMSAIKEVNDRVMGKAPLDITSGGEKIQQIPIYGSRSVQGHPGDTENI